MQGWSRAIVILIFLSMIGYSVWYVSVGVKRTGLESKSEAPTFVLPDLQGQPFQLESLRGEPVMLRFSSPACSFCPDDFQQLTQLQNTYDVNVVAIESGADETRIASRVGSRTLPYPVLMDVRWEAADLYKLPGLPAYYFIDPEGQIVGHIWGELQPGSLDYYLGQVLKESTAQ